MRDLNRLTGMVNAMGLTFDQRAECEEVLKWLTDDPETVARYVVILEAWAEFDPSWSSEAAE